MAHGGARCISVSSNVAPKLCAEFQNACLAGNFKRALEIQDVLMPLHDALFVETNPAPVKYAAWRLGLIESPDCRLPLAPLGGRRAKRPSMRRWRTPACSRSKRPSSGNFTLRSN